MSKEPDYASVNGELILKSELLVSVDDRGLCYGDGLFDTALILKGAPAFLDWRKQRLRRGLAFLEFDNNWIDEFLSSDLDQWIHELISANQIASQAGVLKLIITRGAGPRGYGIPSGFKPSVWIQAYSISESFESLKRVSLQKSLTLGVFPRPVADNDPYRQHKLLNKVPSVLAKTYADQRGWDDALLMDHQGRLLESSGGNLFWLENGELWTPPLELGVLDGITRRCILENVGKLGIQYRTGAPNKERLLESAGIAVTSSIQGWVLVKEFEEHSVPAPEVFHEIREMYWSEIESMVH